MKLLFVCTENLQRSPTAELLFKNSKHKAKSVGISPYATIQITKQAVDWAEVIICMEPVHKEFILKQFPSKNKEIVVLDIPDIYYRNNPELIRLLKEKLKDFLK